MLPSLVQASCICSDHRAARRAVPALQQHPGPTGRVDGMREQGDKGAARSKARASVCWRRQSSCWKGGTVLSHFRRSHRHAERLIAVMEPCAAAHRVLISYCCRWLSTEAKRRFRRVNSPDMHASSAHGQGSVSVLNPSPGRAHREHIPQTGSE